MRADQLPQLVLLRHLRQRQLALELDDHRVLLSLHYGQFLARGPLLALALHRDFHLLAQSLLMVRLERLQFHLACRYHLTQFDALLVPLQDLELAMEQLLAFDNRLLENLLQFLPIPLQSPDSQRVERFLLVDLFEPDFLPKRLRLQLSDHVEPSIWIGCLVIVELVYVLLADPVPLILDQLVFIFALRQTLKLLL